jgi:hypothetical protein
MQTKEFLSTNHGWMSEFASLCTGVIAELDEAGRAWVEFGGNSSGAVGAQSLILVPPSERDALVGREVLLGFQNGDEKRPVILGFIHESILSNIDPDREPHARRTRPAEALVDGKRVHLQADEEIVLGCGKGAIILRKDGKIILRGTEITSRASGSNKIKGGTVSIN